MRRRAFTLVELLVVIGIIAVMVALLAPIINAARHNAARAECRANLGRIGYVFKNYLIDSAGKLPLVNWMPSRQPPVNSGFSIVVLLEPYIREGENIFRCPEDRIVKREEGVPGGFRTYFAREWSSYQYNPYLSAGAADRTWEDTPFARMDRLGLLPVLFDYEPFHPKLETNGTSTTLFQDGRVSDVAEP